MSREPIRIRRIFQTWTMRPSLLWEIRRRFHRLCPGYGQVAHALRTLSPVAGIVLLQPAAPRLACVKPAASVHPEPGSNSSLYILILPVRSWHSINFQRNQRSRFLVSRYLLVLVLVSLFNDLSNLALKKPALRLMAKPSLAIGITKVITFFESANFLLKNLKSDVVKELFNPPFPKGVAKVVTFLESANFL